MKLALVEDDPRLRDTFARLVAELPAHRLVVSYPSAEAALENLRPGDVNLVIADLGLPGTSGIDLIARLREEPWSLPSLVWTVCDARDVVYAAIRAGAIGYLLKSMGVEDLERALHDVEQGGAPMSPSIARRVLQDLMGTGGPTSPEEPLSVQECHVLRAIAAGHRHKEVAVELGISQHTVHSHLKRIYRKLHVHGRTEALQRARQLGIVVQDGTRGWKPGPRTGGADEAEEADAPRVIQARMPRPND